MALLWIEGFEGFGTVIGDPPITGLLGRKYSVVSQEAALDIEAGRYGGYALEFNINSSYLTSIALTTDPTLVVGIAVMFGSIQPLEFLDFYDGTTKGLNLRLATGGELAVYRGTTLLQQTTGLGLTIGTWYYIEFKVVTDNSTGSYEVRLGGVTQLSDSDVDTEAGTHTYHDIVKFSGGNISGLLTIDDIYILDGSGTDANTFLGNQCVIALNPVADTADKDWTPSAGSDNYAMVDEAASNDDTDYVESATTDHLDLYDFEDTALVEINGIQINTTCKLTDASPFTLKQVVKSGTTTDDGATESVPSSYGQLRRIVRLDPDTDVVWTPSGLNAAQFGIEVG